MMNRKKKYIKAAIMFFCYAIFLRPVFSNDSGWLPLDPLSLSIDSGFLCGNISELVFLEADKKKLSELQWEIKPQPYVSACANITILNLFFVRANGKTIFLKEQKCGSMQDFDWQNVQFENAENYLTDYSTHENHLKSYFDGELSFGMTIPVPFLCELEPSASIKYQHIAFSAQNGWGQYGGYNYDTGNFNPITDELPKVFYGKHVVTYEQKRTLFNLGLKISTTILPLFYISLSADYSLSVSITATDSHYIRGIYFRDVFQTTGAWNFGGEIYFVFGNSKPHKIGIAAEYQYIPVITGINEYDKGQIWVKSSDVLGGTKSDLLFISLSYYHSF